MAPVHWFRSVRSQEADPPRVTVRCGDHTGPKTEDVAMALEPAILEYLYRLTAAEQKRDKPKPKEKQMNRKRKKKDARSG
jgi:hypothetical protein